MEGCLGADSNRKSIFLSALCIATRHLLVQTVRTPAFVPQSPQGLLDQPGQLSVRARNRLMHGLRIKRHFERFMVLQTRL